jgi:hypothetical protein
MAEMESRLGRPRRGGTIIVAGMILASAMLALYGGACVYYAVGPTMAGHGESSMVCMAWRFREGAALYAAPDAPEQVTITYGPMQTLLNAGLLWLFGPHVLVAKVAAGLMALAGLACCARVYIQVGDRRTALLGMGWLALAYMKSSMQTFFVRPDAALLLCLSLSLLAVFVLPKRWGWIVLGVAAAWGTNLKITMPAYMVPVAVMYWRRHGFGGVWRAGVLAAILGAAPFVLSPQISLVNYLFWLKVLADQGADIGYMTLPIGGYLALIAGPVACAMGIFAWSRPKAFGELAYRHRWLGVSAAVTGLLALWVAIKPGNGPAHLLPFYPTLGVVLVKSLTELGRGEKVELGGKQWLLAGSGIVMLLALAAFSIRSTWVNVIQGCRWREGWALVREVRGLAEKYEGRGMALAAGSSQERYFTTRYQAELVLRGNPYVLDVTSLMFMQKAGQPIPERTREYLAQGRCPLWLVPRGEAPFELRNWYQPHGMIFDAAFRRGFLAHYRIVDRSEHFDVWGYDEATRGKDGA